MRVVAGASWFRRAGIGLLLPLLFQASGLLADDGLAVFEASGRLHHPAEVHLSEVRQLTFGGENAEAYWSPDGKELIFQSTRPPYDCDQIFRMPADGSGEPRLVSTGQGRTTCAYFSAGGQRILYSSTHETESGCPAVPDRSQGYVWPLYDAYQVYSAAPDGTDLQILTGSPAYDAEATVCPVDGSIVFTSTRDGDLELYRMDADGANVQRLTNTPGYDGGAFFSRDCTQIVWRASRQAEGEELEDYRRLLGQGLVRPSKLELWVAQADGTEARQVTYLDAATFAPYFFPDGQRILFSSNYGTGSPREFDLWAVNVDGSGLERITYAPGFDGFPMFSPDGERLVFASNRNQGKPGETDIYVAHWRGDGGVRQESAADRFAADVAWLAADERQGRGVGTPGLEAAGQWLADQFAALGLEPAGEDGGYRQSFPVPVAVEVLEGTYLRLGGEEVSPDEARPASFSAHTQGLQGEVVAAGYGITAPELSIDDYANVEAQGKIVVVRRFTPESEAFSAEDVKRRYSDLRAKAFNAREHGAAALFVVDLPLVAVGEEPPEEAALPSLAAEAQGDAGIPVFYLTRQAGAGLFSAPRPVTAELAVKLKTKTEAAFNVVGRLRASSAYCLPNLQLKPLVVGAHYDHLGLGGRGSLAPGSTEPHNGADDNASGTAALLEIARTLQQHQGELRRDVVFIAFSGEESGLLGSTAWTRNPTAGLSTDGIFAMINLDMVGRLRDGRVGVLGGKSATEWETLVPPLCQELGLQCRLDGDGYGPSDQTPFYAAGIPVLHFFTGAHSDYHKPSDDSPLINAAGGARIALLTARVLEALAQRTEALTYQQVAAPPPPGDSRSYGAYLGTIPDYAGPEDEGGGVLLAGVREESPAQQAGFQRGDRLVFLAGSEIKDIHDFVFILRRHKPGETVPAAVIRDGQRLELEVTFGSRSQSR